MSFTTPGRSRRAITAAIALFLGCLAGLGLSGCDDDGATGTEEEAAGPPAPEPDPISAAITEVTGAPTRVVWMRYTKTTSSDVYGNFEQFQLWGIDSADFVGERVILEKKGNYSRPLLTPDGKSIVFTRKNTERKGSKKVFKPEIFRVDWNGENLERLGEGYAVDIWQDPETLIEWVYASNLGPTTQSNLYGDKVERFQLIDPMEREPVFGPAPLSPNNIQVSRDGKRMSCLFPWPKVGAVDLEKGERWQNQHGCWPSMAPDNSYAAWVFDGSHRSLHLFGDRGVKHAQISLSEAPGVGGYELYHPRWSNHVRFFAVTGPYTGKTIGDGGHAAEVLLGKFSADLTGVDSWVQITDNGLGDFFPDVWVEGGAQASLDPALFGSDTAPPTDITESTDWPTNNDATFFVWENGAPDGQRMVAARPDGPGHECSVAARGRARFGPHFEMLAGGGYFDIDGESTVLLDQRLDGSVEKRGGGFAVEALVTPSTTADGVILSHPKFQLRQNEGEFRFAALAPRPATMSLGPVVPGKPVHLALSLDDEGWWIFRDGRGRSDDKAVLSAEPMASRRGTTIGGGWDGAIEGVAIYDRSLSAEEVTANHAHFQELLTERAADETPRFKLKAKLLESTAARSVDDIEYSRALICNRYEVVEMTQGSLENDEFVVYHWAVMDRKTLSGFPTGVGEVYDLEIEPSARHPQVVSELRWSDFFDEAHDQYYDITAPSPFAEP